MPELSQIVERSTELLEESLTLLVGRFPEDTPVASKVRLSQSAADAFQGLAVESLRRIESSSPVPFTAEAELDSKEVYVLAPADVEELAPFWEIALVASALPVAVPAEFDAKIGFYGLVAGSDEKVFFMRRADPHIAHSPGRVLAVLRERLESIDEPAFSFSPGFDLLLAEDWAVIVNQNAFEKLFRESGIVGSHISTWVGSITSTLPMSDQAVESLTKVAIDDSRTWRRLREIHRRGHLAQVSIDDIRSYAEHVGISESDLIEDGQLIFDPSDRFSFLHLLNEDLYKGELTKTVYEAQRKTGV